MSEVCII